MRKSLALVGLVLVLLGCRLPPDREDLKLLDISVPIPAYPELYLRTRSQATLALEAFYRDAWDELDQAARALEQTARFLPKSAEIPTALADELGRESGRLQADAVLLGEAARTQSVRAAN